MRKLFYLLSTIVILAATVQKVNAQRHRPAATDDEKKKSASDLHKERLETEASNKVFDEQDKDFKVKDIPDKWKNESAVILAQKTKYDYTADGRSLNFVETKRKRIKLLDKAAVEEFSKFFYYKTGSENKVGIRIVKADGKTKNIGTSEAIEVTNNIPVFFSSSIYGFQVKYYKVAIPDLEVGDIIDFFSEVHGSGYNFTGGAQTLSPIFLTLNSRYPIVKQKYDFIAEKGYFINFKTLNGAPDLKKNSNVDRRTFSYTLEDSDRPRIKDIRWLYDLRRLPSLKFQVCYAKIGAETEQFLGKVGDPVKSVKDQQIAEKVNYYYNNNTSAWSYHVKDIQAFMKKSHRNVKDPMEYLKYAYYYYRHEKLLTNADRGEFVSDDNQLRDDIFVPVFRELMKEQNLDAQVVITAPRGISSINDVVMFEELLWALKIKDKYLFSFNANSNPFDSHENAEGCDGYIVDVNKKGSGAKLNKVTIPASSYNDNLLTSNIDVKMDDNKENMLVNVNTTIKGLMKSSNDYVLRHTDYLVNDYLIYGGEKPTEEETRNKTKIAERERKEAARKEEQKSDKLKQMKESWAENFSNVVSFDEFDLEQSGRSSDKPDLIFSEKLKLGDLIKKAGPNYSVDLTSLIGKQIDIKSDEKERDQDVFLNFAKTLDYTVSLTLPSGYKAEGLDAIKFNVDNNAGSFISSAKMDGNKLVITAKKTYKSANVSKEDWSKMVDFLDAAFNFTQKKIILKKA